MPHPDSYFVAAWSELGTVSIYDVSNHVRALDSPGISASPKCKPVHQIMNHGSTEGYALEWSPLQMGHLLSGDTEGRIFLSRKTAYGFMTESDPFVGHHSSVEDLQFSPNQANVFASASADKTIKIWDARTKPKPQLSVVAHSNDVNVISWNRYVNFYIKSFCDSTIKVFLLSVYGSENKSKLHVS